MDSNDIPPSYAPPPPPPPSSPPPVIMPPSQSRPPRRGRGWMFFALILLAMLLFSLLLNFGQLFTHFTPGRASSMTAGPTLYEVTVEDNDSHDKIAVIDVDGIISGGRGDGSYTMVELIKAQLKEAKDDDRVAAVILHVDSPGGEVLASDEIYHLIERFQKEAHKPVIASMGNLAASGGYYVSAPCRWIVANDLTITGSIGVIMHTWNYRNLMNKIGLRPEVYKSGKHKDMLSGERDPDEVPPEEREMLQALITDVYGKFTNVVVTGRSAAHEKNKDEGKELADDWADYADGRILSGSEALKIGLVDELGTFEDAVKKAEEIAGLGKEKATLIKYQERHDLSDLFRLIGKSEAPVIKVDLGLEAPKLEAGKLYFLSPTYLH